MHEVPRTICLILPQDKFVTFLRLARHPKSVFRHVPIWFCSADTVEIWVDLVLTAPCLLWLASHDGGIYIFSLSP